MGCDELPLHEAHGQEPSTSTLRSTSYTARSGRSRYANRVYVMQSSGRYENCLDVLEGVLDGARGRR